MFGNRLGETQRRAKRLVQGHEIQDLRAFRGRDMHEQRLHRRAGIGKDADPRRLMGQPGPFVEGQIGADLVFLDHRQIGVGRGIKGAQQRAHLAEAVLAGLLVQRAQRAQPPRPRDQAETAIPQRHHLDRGLLAAGGDAGLQRRHVLGAEDHPVAGQVPGLDPVQRQILHHAPALAGAAHLGRQILQRRARRRIARDPRHRRGMDVARRRHAQGIAHLILRSCLAAGWGGRCQASALGHDRSSSRARPQG